MFESLRATVSFVRLSRDLNRLNEVFRFAETLRDEKLYAEGVKWHRGIPGGEKALTERPRLGRLDLDALAKLPAGALGREFADFLRKNKLDPNDIPLMESRDPGEFIFAHYYETHDLWHVLTGFDTDKAGELGLQAFYLGQGGPARLSAMILSAGFLELLMGKEQFGDREARLHEVARGYVMGKRAKPLFGVRWNELWSEPLTAIRERFAIDVEGATKSVS
ncbi:Coq4 family protein [soil metagenome]